jgi:hypothetical protein
MEAAGSSETWQPLLTYGIVSHKNYFLSFYFLTNFLYIFLYCILSAFLHLLSLFITFSLVCLLSSVSFLFLSPVLPNAFVVYLGLH